MAKRISIVPSAVLIIWQLIERLLTPLSPLPVILLTRGHQSLKPKRETPKPEAPNARNPTPKLPKMQTPLAKSP